MKISFIGQPEYFRFCYEQDLSRDNDVREFPFHFSMSSEELHDLVSFDADVNFFFRGEFAPHATLSQLNGKKIAISSEPFPRSIDSKLEFTFDSLSRYIDFRKRIRYLPFDYVFHYDEASLDFLRNDGLFVSGAFPFPVATETYTKLEGRCEWDVFFIGRSSNHREKFFGPLKHNFNFLHICHGIFGPALIEYFSKAKICLNVHAENEISWEPRIQMMLAAGAFVISEPITPNSFLRPGVDYIVANSPSDMFEKVEYYLNHESERHTIANSGRTRVREFLNAKDNFARLIHDIEHGIHEPFRASKPSLALELISFFYRAKKFTSRAIGK